MLKYRNEDISFFFFIAAFICFFAAGNTFMAALKKAEDEQRIPVDVQQRQL